MLEIAGGLADVVFDERKLGLLKGAMFSREPKEVVDADNLVTTTQEGFA